MVKYFSKMALSTREQLRMVKKQEKEHSKKQMEAFMKASLKVTNFMVKESLKQTNYHMRVNSEKANLMDMEPILHL